MNVDQTALPAPTEGVSSTPGQADDPIDRLAAMSAEDRRAWRLTGTLPEDAPPAPQADGSDATDPAPVDGQPQNGDKTKPPRLDARKQKIQEEINGFVSQREQARREAEETRAEVARLQQQREFLTRGQVTEQPQQQVQPQQTQQHPFPVDPSDPEPDPTGYTDFNLLTRDQAAWAGRQASRHEFFRLQQMQQHQQAQQQQQQALSSRLQTFEQAHPDFREVAARAAYPTFPQGHPHAGMPATQTAAAIVQYTQHSDLGPDLMYYLGSHDAEMQTLLSLPWAMALGALGRIEGGLKATALASTPGTRQSASNLTQAPAPPPTVGTRTTAPADDLDAALKDGDYARYSREMNRREMAGSKR